jgi:hypothetical protein
MEFEDFRKQRSVKFLEQHELNDDEYERLIENKLNRARVYYEALLKREDRLAECD